MLHVHVPLVTLGEGIVRFCEFKMFKLGPSCVNNHSNGLGRIRTSYFSGKNEVSLVTMIFGKAEVYTRADCVCCGFNRFRRMEGTVYLEKEI
jgi:hypothetical protein